MNLTDASTALGRIMIAVLFLFSGIGKAMAPAAMIAFIGSVHLPLPTLAYAGATVLEIAGSIALMIGFKTRWIAGALAAYSLVTAFVFHADFADQNQMFHFLKNVAVAGGLLHVAALGGGGYAFDHFRSRT